MDVYGQIAAKIIEQQESIIGPVAIEQAKSISGMTVNWDKKEVTITGDEVAAIDKLVAKYKTLFGQISVEVCKEAASKFSSQLTGEKLPKSLK